MNADDLLSFKEFPPIHDSYARGGGSAEININSPNRNHPSQQAYGDQAFNDLVNQMSTSVQVMNTQENTPTQSKFNSKPIQLFCNTIFCLFPGRWSKRKSTIPFILQHWILSAIFQCWNDNRNGTCCQFNYSKTSSSHISKTTYWNESRSLWSILDCCYIGTSEME